MHKLHLILKTSKSPWPDFMRTVQSLRKCCSHDKLCRWRAQENTHTPREWKKRKTILCTLQHTNPNPLHMIQNYFSLNNSSSTICIKPLHCVGLLTPSLHIYNLDSLPDNTLTKQITTINTQLLSIFPTCQLTTIITIMEDCGKFVKSLFL